MNQQQPAVISPRELTRENRLNSYLIYLEEVVVEFDGFRALDIDLFGLKFNELRVVIGPNGAGKTTLCDVISGKTPTTRGHRYWQGNSVDDKSDSEMALLGVGRKFQTPTVFDSLTVFENMEMALPGAHNVWRTLRGRMTDAEEQRILEILDRVNLTESRDVPARFLSHGQRQSLELCMLILAGPDLLLVDEPAAGLTDDETDLMADLLLELRGQHAILVIEHDMEFVRRLNAGVTVLHEGKIMTEGSMEEVQQNPAVVEAYLGR